ncbi:MAG: acylphosphatase [Chloroflexi bacterium]|nr:MAG: acylphosphatase [Chloroflexota bacterium]
MRGTGPEAGVDRASLHAIVRGRVQGVGFRDFVYTRARTLHLTGYVRNLADGGSIEVRAEGSRPALESLLEHVNRGPRSAIVRSVDAEWGEATGRYAHFDVLG